MDAYKDIYELYADYVYRFLLCLTSSQQLAEELTQETFYQAVKSIKRYNGECKIEVWLCQIAKHMYYNYLKYEKHRKHISFYDLSDNDKQISVTPEEVFITNENIDRIWREINNLDDISREVMVCRISNNMNFREIGGICSEDSRIEIEKHIADCEHCHNEYKKMSGVDVESVIKDKLEIKRLKEPFVKTNTRYHIKVLSVVIVILILLGLIITSNRPGIINPDLKDDIEYNEKIYWKYIWELYNQQPFQSYVSSYTQDSQRLIRSVHIDHESRSYFWHDSTIYIHVDFIYTFNDETSVKINGLFSGVHYLWGFVRWHNGFHVSSVSPLEE